MMFTKRLRDPIKRGEITCSVRIWTRPHVRVGGRYRVDADGEVEVATLDAQETTRRLARENGLLVGVSAGANVFAAVRLARTLPKDSVVVTILCDSGSRYLADKFWEPTP